MPRFWLGKLVVRMSETKREHSEVSPDGAGVSHHDDRESRLRLPMLRRATRGTVRGSPIALCPVDRICFGDREYGDFWGALMGILYTLCLIIVAMATIMLVHQMTDVPYYIGGALRIYAIGILVFLCLRAVTYGLWDWPVLGGISIMYLSTVLLLAYLQHATSKQLAVNG